MKMLEDRQEFHTHGVHGKLDYEVVSNAKMMKLLSDSLYADKVAAPIRELSTNAWDSHVDANNLIPFDVQLPSESNLTFRIRDYGTGMSPDKVERLYRKYGASDKTETNDLQGCMGLGSKSPFAYTKQFTSISYYNGKKYIWINSKDERGIPSLNRMAVEDTDEPNGFEISFSVKANDVSDFWNKAQKIYRPFPVCPNVTGGPSRSTFKPLKHEYMMKSDDSSWTLTNPNMSYHNKQTSYAVMGLVEYPIDPGHFIQKKVDEDDPDVPTWYKRGYTEGYYNNPANVYTQLLNMGLVIQFDTGEVEMDISREGLQYHMPTIEAIRVKLDVILDEIKAKVDQRFVKCKSRWDARCLYKELMYGDLIEIQELCYFAKAQWNGFDITDDIFITNKDIPGTSLLMFESTYRGKTVRRRERITSIAIPTSSKKKPAFYVNDVKRGAYAACGRVVLDDNNDYNKVYLLRFDDDVARDTFIEYVGIDKSDLHYVSKLPKPPKQKRGPIITTFELNANSTLCAHEWWTESKIDLDNGGTFVEINRYETRKKDGTRAPTRQTVELLQKLEALGIAIPQIYGVKTISVGKFRKHKKWTDLFDWAEQQFNDYLKQNNLQQYVADIHTLDGFCNSEVYLGIAEHANGQATTTSPFYKFVERIKNLQRVRDKHKTKVSAAIALARMLGIDAATLQNNASSTDLETEEDNILSRYGMLKLIDAYDLQYSNNLKRVVEYIDFVDSVGGKN